MLFGFGVGTLSALAPDFFADNRTISAIGLGVGALCVILTVSWAAWILAGRFPAARPLQILSRSGVACIGLCLIFFTYLAIMENLYRVDIGFVDAVPGTGPDRYNLVFINPNDFPIENVVFWISPASAKLNASNPAYGSVDRGRPAQTYTQGATNLGINVPSGQYLVELNMANGLLLQELNIGDKQHRITVRNRETGERVFP